MQLRPITISPVVEGAVTIAAGVEVAYVGFASYSKLSTKGSQHLGLEIPVVLYSTDIAGMI